MALFDTLIERILGHEGGYVSSDEIKSALDMALYTESFTHAQPVFAPKNARQYECSEGCGNKAYAKGLCNAHYLRARNGKAAELPVRNRKAGYFCIECGDPQTTKGGLGRCPAHYRTFRRRALKQAAVTVMGGCCMKCSGHFCLSAYDFHHVGAKTDNPSSMFVNASTQRIADELAHCVLLCANCHREVHANDFI